MYFPNCSAVPSYYVEMLEVIHEPAADTKLFHLVDVSCHHLRRPLVIRAHPRSGLDDDRGVDRKSTRLNSSHGYISYAVFCLKKKKKKKSTDYLIMINDVVIERVHHRL